MKPWHDVFRQATQDAEAVIKASIGGDFRVPSMLDAKNAQSALLYLGGEQAAFRLAGAKHNLRPGLSEREFQLEHRKVFSEYDTEIGSCFHLNAVSRKAGKWVRPEQVTHVRAVGFIRTTPLCENFNGCVERVNRVLINLTEMGLAPGVLLHDAVRKQVTALWRLREPLIVTGDNRAAVADALLSGLPYEPGFSPIPMEGIVAVPGIAELDYDYHAQRTTATVRPDGKEIEPLVPSIAELLAIAHREVTATEGAHIPL